jgi:predicted amidohydrolase YtcJ
MHVGEPVAVLRSVEVAGEVVDVALADGHVAAIGPGVTQVTDGLVLDADGGWLLPGLHDHHLHLRSLAAELASIHVGPPEVPDATSLGQALAAADARLPADAWIRATGYHESVAGELDRHVLDHLLPGRARPIRVQHRSGALWTLNDAALAAIGEPEHPDGRFFRQDAWLAERVPPPPMDLSEVGRVLASSGVLAVTDATPHGTAAALQPLADAVRSGALPQRVVVMGAPALDPTLVPAPLLVGPAKLLLPDHALPPLDELVEAVQSARSFGRAVAVHCVTREALALTVAVLDAAGGSVPGDRIEHGAIVPPDLRAEVLRLGLTVVTQPNLVAERGDDYLELVDPDDLPHLWPCRSLIDAGIPVLGGTDAPFGRPDPWALIAAATTRRSRAGTVLGANETIGVDEALALVTTTGATEVRVGDPADLIVSQVPRAATLTELRAGNVAATIVGGRSVPPPRRAPSAGA